MKPTPRLLVAGDSDFQGALLGRFPPSLCQGLTAPNVAGAIRQAPDAAVVVVQSSFVGCNELCTQLRADPLTSQIPLIVAVDGRGEVVRVKVNATIAADNLELIDATVRRLAGLPEGEADGRTAPAPRTSGEDASLEELQRTGPSAAARELLQAPAAEPDALAPETLEMGDGEAQELFDDEPQTVVFRRPEAKPGGATEWPPMPPTLEGNQDMVDHTQVYAGYLNSLVEALQAPHKLSQDEKQRLRRVSKYTLNDSEVLLGALQTAVNAALMNKDLARMRVLSAGKNRLYDNRQTLRTLLQKLERELGSQEDDEAASALEELLMKQNGSGKAPGPDQALSPEPSPTPLADEPPAPKTRQRPTPAAGMTPPANPPPARKSPTPSPLPDKAAVPAPAGDAAARDAAETALEALSSTGSFSAAKKSKLTLAAEAKQAEAKQARVAALQAAREKARERAQQRRENPAAARRARAAARKKGKGGGYGWVWIPVVALVLLGIGLGVHYYLTHGDEAPATTTDNQPPTMKWVILEQTASGIVARPQAEDKEQDRISYIILWYRNGRAVQGERTARLRPTAYQTGDTVFAEVTPADSFAKGRPMRSQELIVKKLRRR